MIDWGFRWIRRQLPGDPRTTAVLLAYTINALGSGLWLTGGTIFLIQGRQIPPSDVGIGLTIGGVAGVAVGILAGSLADRVGARNVAVAALAVECAAMVAFLGVGSLATLIVVATVAAAGLASTNAARGALLAETLSAAEATHARAVLRNSSNIAISIGGLIAGVLLGIATPTAYRVLALLDAGTFVAAGLVLMNLPAIVPRKPEHYDIWHGLKDNRYMAATAISAILTMQYGVISVGIPLWITKQANVPTYMLAPLIILNTGVCVALQVRASRGLEIPAKAGRATVKAGGFFLAATALVALAGIEGTLVASALLLVAVAVHSIGEVLQAGSSFGMSFSLAPDGMQGQYQGIWNVGYSLGESLSPYVMSIAVAASAGGWLALGALFVVASLAFNVIVVREPLRATRKA